MLGHRAGWFPGESDKLVESMIAAVEALILAAIFITSGVWFWSDMWKYRRRMSLGGTLFRALVVA